MIYYGLCLHLLHNETQQLQNVRSFCHRQATTHRGEALDSQRLIFGLASVRTCLCARARVSCLYGSWRELQWGCLSSALPALINGYDDNPVLKTAPEKQRQWALTMAEEDDARIRILQSLRGKICKFTLRDQCCPSIAVGRRVREVGTGTSERRLLMIRQP